MPLQSIDYISHCVTPFNSLNSAVFCNIVQKAVAPLPPFVSSIFVANLCKKRMNVCLVVVDSVYPYPY